MIFFPGGEPPGVAANKGSGFWLDFFVICDDASCHLFFTDDDRGDVPQPDQADRIFPAASATPSSPSRG